MNAKQYLMQVSKINCELNALLEQIEILETTAQRITPILSDMPKGGTNTSRIENAVADIADLKATIMERIHLLVSAKKEVLEVILKVDDMETRTLLGLRYLNNKSWEEIAESMHVTQRTAYRLHGKGLALVSMIISQDK